VYHDEIDTTSTGNAADTAVGDYNIDVSTDIVITYSFEAVYAES
jgi:hypothetical protein